MMEREAMNETKLSNSRTLELSNSRTLVVPLIGSAV